MRTDENRKSKQRGQREKEREREAQQSERDNATQSGDAVQIMAGHLPLGRFLHQYRRIAVMAPENEAQSREAKPPPKKDARFALALEKPSDPSNLDGPPEGGRLIAVMRFPDGSQDALRFSPKDEKSTRDAVKQGQELPGAISRPGTGTPIEEKKTVLVDGEQIAEAAAYARQATRQNFRPGEYDETAFARGIYHATMDQDAPSVETLMPESAEVERRKKEREE